MATKDNDVDQSTTNEKTYDPTLSKLFNSDTIKPVKGKKKKKRRRK